MDANWKPLNGNVWAGTVAPKLPFPYLFHTPSLHHAHVCSLAFSKESSRGPSVMCFRDSSRKTCENKLELVIYKYIFFSLCFVQYMPIIHTAASWYHDFQILSVFHVFLPSDGLWVPTGLDLFPLKPSSACWKARVADLFRSFGLSGITPADRCFLPDGESLLNHV